jgi:hypothetical protein
MKMILVRRDVSVPLWILLVHLLGGSIVVAAAVMFFAGVGSMCQVYATISVGLALTIPFYWSLRRASPTPRQTRVLVAVCIGVLITALASADCWLGG